MPELPEVESVRRALHKVFVGQGILAARAVDDPIVFRGLEPKEIERRLTGSSIGDIGRKGKYFWLVLDGNCLAVHFGMSGWAHVLPLEDSAPKFAKLTIDTENARVVFTDPRRLGRIWFTPQPEHDPQIARLGFDVHDELPSERELLKIVHRRRVAIKAVLLDQGVFAGIGNWLADEVLYQARIAPMRAANSLSEKEVSALRRHIQSVVGKAVEVDADSDQFPSDWLFHHRWGGKRGPETIGRHEIERETVAGRTTAWVPAVQR